MPRRHVRHTAPSPGWSSYDPVLIRQALTITPGRGRREINREGGGERKKWTKRESERLTDNEWEWGLRGEKATLREV